MSQYDLIFTGEVIEGCDPAQVRRDLEKLFKTDSSAISRLFTGKPVIIKKALDEQTALRYRAALQKAGALCQLRSSAGPGGGESANPPAGLAGATILPPGSLLTRPQAVSPPEFDFSGMSLAPAGVTLVEPETPEFLPLPDLGDLELAAAGEDLVKPAPSPPASMPDTVSMTIAPPGADLLTPDERRRTQPPPPDTGDLSLIDD